MEADDAEEEAEEAAGQLAAAGVAVVAVPAAWRHPQCEPPPVGGRRARGLRVAEPARLGSAPPPGRRKPGRPSSAQEAAGSPPPAGVLQPATSGTCHRSSHPEDQGCGMRRRICSLRVALVAPGQSAQPLCAEIVCARNKVWCGPPRLLPEALAVIGKRPIPRIHVARRDGKNVREPPADACADRGT